MPDIVGDNDRALAELRRYQFDDGPGELWKTVHQQKIDRAAAISKRNQGIALAKVDQIGNPGFGEIVAGMARLPGFDFRPDDESAALVDTLRAGRIAGPGLDVYDIEPLSTSVTRSPRNSTCS